MEEIFELAKKTQINMADEANAIVGYTDQLKMLDCIKEKHPEYAETIGKWIAVIEEITADELNHQEKLNALYSEITDIYANRG